MAGAGSTALADAGGVTLVGAVVVPAAEAGVAIDVESAERALVARFDVPSFGGWVPEQAASRMIAACQRMRAV